jgi:TRAP transporter 4TM/12TM fusion protein
MTEDTDTSETDDAGEPVVDPEEQQELIEELERKRSLRGAAVVAVAAVGILFSAFQLWLAARGFELSILLPVVGEFQLAALQLLQINAIHVGFALVLAFLLYPPSTGDGRVATRLGRVVPGLGRRFGDDHPLTRAAARLRSGVRWAAIDRDRERVTPVDFACIAVTLLAVLYFITDFAEIQNTVRLFGLRAARPLPEVFTFLEPIAPFLGPFSEYSWAFVLGVAGVLLVLEATRRSVSLWLVIIVVAFIVYARYGFRIDSAAPVIGVLAIPELGWDSIIQNLWYNTENGVFGIPVTVSVQFIYIFILFGAFLEMSGAGQWFIDLAYAATGRRKGGPAKASILASGFMGTISGSSIANTVTTGAFTIPLMKRSGYRPEFAGAVEASASSGGQILPPVMGAAAFLIVQYTATPFADVIVAAAIPAIVFFFGVWVMVHLEASRIGLGTLDDADIVRLRDHLRKGWFYLVPLGLLLYYLLVERLSVARSAWFTIVAVGALIALVAAYSDDTRWPLAGTLVALFAIETATRATVGVGLLGVSAFAFESGLGIQAALTATAGNIGWLAILAGILVMAVRPMASAPLLEYDPQVATAVESTAERLGRPSLASNNAARFVGFLGKSMDSGARTAVPVVVAVAAAGIIPGIISVSGLGPNLADLIRTVSAGSLPLLLVLTAISAIILGMGMPTTVTYIILVSMLATPLVTEGLPELGAHLFILYFGVIADITPPVAVAAYAASGVAKSDPFQTGVEAFSLSLNKAIVPFAFILAPGILLLREKANAASLPPGERYRVLNSSDFLDVGFIVPEVVVPVLGVVLGVVGLAVTVIGFLYSPVSRLERAGFALASLLLMAPALLSQTVFDLLGVVGVSGSLEGVVLWLGLRLAGLVLFVLLTIKNRRAGGPDPDTAGTPEAA